ncbi:MAG: hypothetical protein ACJ8DI_22230 [Ktedonobacteraceae bacterium]
MATQTTSNRTGATSTSSLAFERFAGVCALIVGIGGLLYAISFIILKSALLSDLFLMLGGLFSTAVLVALYNRLRETDAAFALWGLVLSITAALGSAIHGGYDLANVLHPVSQVTDAAAAGVPNAVDPRGVLTFLIGGIGLFVIAWLIGRNERFPKMLSYLGYLAAVLLIILYLGRLIIYTPTNPVILIPALLSGFLVNPIWYIWLGISLWGGRKAV